MVSGRECDIDGCNLRGYLERDHTHDYAKGGPTAFWNLGWLCYVHHRLKSAGWELGAPDPATRNASSAHHPHASMSAREDQAMNVTGAATRMGSFATARRRLASRVPVAGVGDDQAGRVTPDVGRVRAGSAKAHASIRARAHA